MSKARNRARILILSHMTQFSLAHRYGDLVVGGLRDMAFCEGAIPGDLVALSSAPPSKWYLGWLIEKKWPEGYTCEVYTVESIEDGELCNWHNVTLRHYDRSQTSAHPEWRWTDEQHAVNDRWMQACYKKRGAYLYRPMQAGFFDSAVELNLRRSHSDEIVGSRLFDNWRRVTQKQMLAFYDATMQEIENRAKSHGRAAQTIEMKGPAGAS